MASELVRVFSCEQCMLLDAQDAGRLQAVPFTIAISSSDLCQLVTVISCQQCVLCDVKDAEQQQQAPGTILLLLLPAVTITNV